MPTIIRYAPHAALKLLPPDSFSNLEPRLDAARDEVLRDAELFHKGGEVPAEKVPLDAGFIRLPEQLLDEHSRDRTQSLLSRILETADRLREEVDRFVVLGIGGSYMGARALFEALCPPYHNELDRTARGGPRLYFEGNNVDNDTVSSLLALLRTRCTDPTSPAQRWAMTVISKSGGTLETAVAFRLFRQAIEEFYGPDSEESRRYVVPVTGAKGKLRELALARGYPAIFPIPEGVGGRFSVFTAVGLLPAAVLGLDIEALLHGAADMTDHFRRDPIGGNPVLDYAAIGHLFETERGATIRVLSTWGARMEALGLWYDQLLSESLGKQRQTADGEPQRFGATPVTVVNTRDLHSRGQQHQEGRRDKLITNVIVGQPSSTLLSVPEVGPSLDQDELNALAGKTLPDILAAATVGTNRAYEEDAVPTADIVLPKLDAYAMGQLMQLLMLATVVEGRLLGVNPYGQPGVEMYKRKMTEILYNS